MIFCIALVPSASSGFEGELEKDLQKSLLESREIVATIQDKLHSGFATTLEIARIRTAAENIRITHKLLEERFKLREEKVRSLGTKAVERHQAMAEGYRKALTEYLSIIDSLPFDGVVWESEIRSLQSLLERLHPKKHRPIIGSLPYKHLNYPAQEPREGGAITPAYKGGNKTVSPDDTKGTSDAPISTEIATLAQSLNWSPVSIYEYVKNNVDTEWYWGCMKGAEETLRQKSGNDCDQAALLTALLRASGFPTRYVRGVIEFFPDIDRAKNLTGIDDALKIAEFMQKAGIPYKPVITGGAIANIQIEHVWVESLIPYANYRGAIIDEYGKTWLGLDTSIKVKGYDYQQTAVGSQHAALMGQLSGIRDDYLGLSSQPATSQSPTPLEYLQSRISSGLASQNPQLAYADFRRTRELVPEALNILPASLQFTLIKATSEYTTLPNELIHKVRFLATDPQHANVQPIPGSLIDITLPTYKLSNQQIVISYEPETVQDQEIIDSYGGLDNTPAYLVHLRPVLKVNNERIVVAHDGLPMGGEFNLALDLISPNGTESIINSHIVGNLSVISISAQRAVITPSPLAGEGGGEGGKDAARLLYEEAMNYNDRWNKAEDEFASLLHLSISRPLPSVVTLGGVIDVTCLLDTPHGFTWKGVFIDAGLKRIEAVSGTQSTDDRAQTFMKLSSLQGSILENRIFEDDFKVESISTAKLLQIINQGSEGGGQGSGILTIDKTNIDTLLRTLAFDDNIKEDMRDAVNRGLVLRTPDSELAYEDWTGIGYLKENFATGESGWMLSGMIAGGMTAWNIDKWNAIIAGTLSNPFSEPSNYDPASARYIEKIAKTDMQEGTAGLRLDEPLQVRVLDASKKPVKNVQVTFTIRTGGGTFGNDFVNIITTTTATTNAKGIASASPILGRYTRDNPTFVWEEGCTYTQQAGENIIDAALPSGTNLAIPFTALGLPDKENLLMSPLHGDGTYSSILSFAGFVSVSVEDKYANRVSNIPVIFTSTKLTDLSCSADKTKNYAALMNAGATCLKQSPVWGDCGDPVSILTVTSSSAGAIAEVILGSVPDAIYPIIATVGSLSTTFDLHTYEFGNCMGNSDPSNVLVVTSVQLNDQYGNNINAGKTDSIMPVSAKIYYVREGEKTINETLFCNAGPLSCSRIVGDTTYHTDTEFGASVTFSDTAGKAQEGGVYKADYKLQPGKNTITVKATADITNNKSKNSCSGCITDPNYTLTNTGTATMTLYGVTVQTQPVPVMLVNENGYLSKDQIITYSIEPLSSDYKALTSYVMIYKDGNIVAEIPTETKGTGFATISRGFKFDVNSKYEAEVILNYGTGVEIRGEKKEIPVAQVRVLTDESTPREADEIKFSDGSNGGNGTKKYHIEIKSQSWLSLCETLTGRIVTLSTATATTGRPVSTPQNAGDTYAASYTLAFKHPLLPIGNNLCNVQIKDALDNGSLKDKFILSNRPRTDLDVGLPYSNINNTAVLYGGIGNKFWVEVSGVGIAVPIEPVGVVILGIDGLRQDVLYKLEEQQVNPAGQTSPYYVSLSDVKGFCAVMGGKYDDGVLGVGSTCDPTGAENKHIKLPNVTTIFPSITFAAWASIFTGMPPSATGITGNEFFARDLYGLNTSNNQYIPGMDSLPSGMVTLDADGGAMRAKPTSGLVSSLLGWINESAPFALDYVMPAEFLGFKTLSKKIATSAPGNALKAVPLWKAVNDMVTEKYQINTSDRCDQSANECRTVSMFNQYAAGADWWGTPSVKWMTLWNTVWESSIFDSASTSETVDFISDYFKQPTTNGKRKRFPALFSVYLPGLDHDAHMSGMGHYRTYVQDTLDAKVSQIVSALKVKDEFDNKIFIIVSDHGHTAMPTDLTYESEIWDGDNIATQPTTIDIPIDMSCSLKTDMLNEDIRESELHNNNLHIWELAEVMKNVGKFTRGHFSYRVLAPGSIAALYSEEDYGARATLPDANVIAALNGPMAHIYVTDQADLGKVAEIFKLTMQGEYKAEANSRLGLDEKSYKDLKSTVGKLKTAIDKILVRLNNKYCVFDAVDDDGSSKCWLSDLLTTQDYTDAWTRINGMNHPNRSGDIVLIMKDTTTASTSDRYTTAYACKSWHGSLNPGDSYVPFIVSYPGGNKYEMENIIRKATVCNTDYSGCKANWKLPNIIKEIISDQNK